MKKIITILALFALIAAALAGCGGGGGGSSSGGDNTGGDWYYHWNCNGDSQCLALNPGAMNQASGTVGPESGGLVGCNSLRTFASINWNMPPAVDACTQSTSMPLPTITGFTPTAGGPGATVTVTGTYLTGGTVKINGVTAVVTSVSDTQIVFTIPLMADFTGSIVITSPWGTVTSTGTLAVARESSVYWSAYNDGSILGGYTGGIFEVGKNGGNRTTLKSGLTNDSQLAVDSTNVYWTLTAGSGSVSKVGISTGTVTALATGLRYPFGVAVDSADVYWVEQNATDGSAIVKKVPIAGGTKTTVGAHPPSGLTCINCPAKPFSIALDAANVYFIEPYAAVYKVPKAGGSFTSLASIGAAGASSLAVDATSVYWIDGANIKKIATGGGAITTLATGTSPASIAVDATSVYWIDGPNIRKTSITGGTATTLAVGTTPSFLTVDAANVYWVDGMSIVKVGINGGTKTDLSFPNYGPPRSIVVDMP